MRKRSSWIMSIAVLALTPGLSQAQVTLGPTLAYDNDVDFGIGAMVGVPLSSFGDGVRLMADVVLFFPDATGVDYFEINGGVTYDFPVENSTVTPFALAGINIGRTSVDIPGLPGGSSTELGLNVGGGIKFDAGNLRPTAGVRLEISGGELFVIFASLPFQLGG